MTKRVFIVLQVSIIVLATLAVALGSSARTVAVHKTASNPALTVMPQHAPTLQGPAQVQTTVPISMFQNTESASALSNPDTKIVPGTAATASDTIVVPRNQ